MRHEIRLSGSGGQGLITAGIILARAAALFDGKNAVQSQSYGPEARGGASKSEVIISTNDINYPKVSSPEVLVALTQEALNKYIDGVKDDAVLIVDSMLVKQVPKGKYKVYSIPVLKTASETLGAILTANIITLGALNKVCKFVSDSALEKAVTTIFPPKATELNMKALKTGAELIEHAC